MRALSIFLATSLLTIITGVQAGAQTCTRLSSPVEGYQTVPQYYCDLCGQSLLNNDYKGPYHCRPLNITFDDISTGPIAAGYQYATWKEVAVVNQNMGSGRTRQVRPYSPPQYALIKSGKTGVLNYTGSSGGSPYLNSLRYGCVNPDDGLAAYCQVTLSGLCDFGLTTNNVTRQIVTTQLEYWPDGQSGMSMAKANAVLPQFYNANGAFAGTVCYEFNFTAIGAYGLPADLLLDEMLVPLFYYTG